MPDKVPDPKRPKDQSSSTRLGGMGDQKATLWQVRKVIDALCEEPFEIDDAESGVVEDVTELRNEMLKRARRRAAELQSSSTPPEP